MKNTQLNYATWCLINNKQASSTKTLKEFLVIMNLFKINLN